jgi:hypothetical protein
MGQSYGLSMFTTIKRWSAYVGAVVAGWFTILVLITTFSDAAPGAIAIFPGHDFIEHLPEGASIFDFGKYWIGIRSNQPGLGLALYNAGAVLVLPAGLPGCLPLAAPG